MKFIRTAQTFILTGLFLGLIAILKPTSLPIFAYFSIGHVLIVVGLGLYFFRIWQDLKRHKVL